MHARRPKRPGFWQGLRQLLLLFLVFAAGAATLGGVLWRLGYFVPPMVTKPPTPSPAVLKVAGKGRLDPGSGIISVYGLPGDRIARMNVQVGQWVDPNQVLFVLASKEDREAEKVLAERQLREAEQLREAIDSAGVAKLKEIDAEITQATAGREADLESLRKKIEFHCQQVATTSTQMKRLDSLVHSTLSEQEREQQRLALAQAETELFAAERLLAVREATYEHGLRVAEAKRETAKLEIAQARERVPVESLKQSAILAARRFDQTRVHSPIYGQVVRIFTPTGDGVLGPQPVLQVANLDRMFVVAEVGVDRIRDLRTLLSSEPEVCAVVSEPNVLGRGVKLSGPLSYRSISQIVGPTVFKPSLPGALRDRRVVEIRVELTCDKKKLARQFVDLEVDVSFEKCSGCP